MDELLTKVSSFLSSSFQNFSEFLRSQAPTVRWVNDFCNRWLWKHICFCNIESICVRKAKKCAEHWSLWFSLSPLIIKLLWLVLTGDCLPGKERLCGSPGPRGSSGWVERLSNRMRVRKTFLTRQCFFVPLTDGVILVDPEYLKDRKGRTAVVQPARAGMLPLSGHS